MSIEKLTLLIKEARNSKGWTQSDLALRSQVGLATIQNIEHNKGNPEFKTIEKILNVLGIEIVFKTSNDDIDFINFWINLGVPLYITTPQPRIIPTLHLFYEKSNFAFEYLLNPIRSSRDLEAFCSFFCAIRDHYPSIYKNLNFRIQTWVTQNTPLLLRPKLRRLSLEKIKEFM